ncbi:uncharacterized protein SPSK_03502 [Sporothrix schenckii 1099-18]|uniref:DUF1275 domain protein n=2 Tax=Sporothrix schenckii TaxID=29908 RepID=U7PSQ4_SPOS1|nr:uncharacterized protein SPSK_03502 [Sporothrix schenckii 1099-18]ERS97951.1 hypothetical protein HMPREF1624_06123 [Sporothrix schenckii ATCC 58251]KJR82530.1 hypothetical protein SPSK_03502 [Sporothrix schenckii 1099-18]
MADTQSSTADQLFIRPTQTSHTDSQPSSCEDTQHQMDSQKEKDSTRNHVLPTTSKPSTSSPAESTGSEHAVWSHLMATVRPTLLAEIELILLTIFTGMQDAVSFPDYHCFASNQTGNTVFLMLALVLPHLNGEMFFTANIGAALGFFLAGGWLTGQLSHIIGPRNRLWLIACNFWQSVLVFGAGAIQHVYGIDMVGSRTIAVISLLAFASGSQVVQSRSLAMTEISTAMATAAWVDLLIDPKLFVLSNRPRTRRVVFLFALVVGALLGAAIYRTVGSSVAILVSAGGKMLVAIMYLFNEAEKPKEEDSTV